MRVTPFTKRALATRRFARQAKADGFESIPGPWDMDRGWRWREGIAEVRFLPGSNLVWIKSDGGAHYEAEKLADRA